MAGPSRVRNRSPPAPDVLTQSGSKEGRNVRNKLRLYAAAVAVVALGVLVSGTAVATAGTKGKRTLRIVAVQIQSDFLDLGAPGPSLGDELVFSESLRRGGHEIGTSGVVCTVTQVTPPYTDVMTLHCVGTLSLRSGQITLQGLVEVQGENDPGPFTVAITGGTGAYRGASGEAVYRMVRDTRSVYRLRLDSKSSHHKKKHRR
jgi:hypothetical protein